MAVELALQFRKNQPNRPGRASGGGDEALDAGTGPAQVAFEAINHHLGVGDVVEGGDRTVADAEAFLHHLHHRCQAIGGAGGGGQQAVAAGVVEVVVDAVDDVECFRSGDHPFHRTGHNHPLQAHRTEVGLEGGGGFELAAAFEHQLHTGLLPGHGGGFFLLAVTHPPLLHQKAVGLAGRPLVAGRFGGA